MFKPFIAFAAIAIVAGQANAATLSSPGKGRRLQVVEVKQYANRMPIIGDAPRDRTATTIKFVDAACRELQNSDYTVVVKQQADVQFVEIQLRPDFADCRALPRKQEVVVSTSRLQSSKSIVVLNPVSVEFNAAY